MKKLAIILAIALVAVGIWAVVAQNSKSDLQAKIDELNGQVESQTGLATDAQATADAAQTELATAKSELAAAQTELEEAKGELETAKTELAAAQAKIEELNAAPTVEVTPTQAPTATPTQAPTATPTQAPTATPTMAPTATPTVAPVATQAPTVAPAQASVAQATERPVSSTVCDDQAAIDAKSADATEAPAAEKAAVATALPAETATAEVSADSTGTPASGERVEVTIWHTFTDDQDAMLNQIADDFNASQDQYTVLVQTQTYQGFLDSVYNAVANGVGPNIIINYASTAAEYVEDGLVLDLSKYVYDDEIGIADIIASLPAEILAEATGFADGGMYSLPAVTTGPILFYNKTLYDELGIEPATTWEGIAEQAKLIYEEKGIPGFAADSLTDMMQALMIQSGAGYIDVANKTVLFGTEEATAWLKWFGENVQAGYFALNPTGDYWSNDFNAGLVASYLGSCAGVPYIEPDGFAYAVAPMVRQDEAAWYPSWNRGPIVFNTTEEENMGAYEFVKFFLQPENNAKWAIAMNALSPYGTTQETDTYKEYAANMDASLVAVQDNLDVAGALPSITGAYATREALKEAATMVAGGMDAEEAMAACVEASNAALQG